MELIRRIIEVAPSLQDGKIPQQRAATFRKMLCALSLVNHTWLDISRPFLYSDIIVGLVSSMTALSRTFTEHAERAVLCTRFQLQGDDEGEATRASLVNEVLEGCPRLSTLELNGMRTKWPSAWDALLGEC